MSDAATGRGRWCPPYVVVLLAPALLFFAGCKGSSEKRVATVVGVAITEKDFTDRYSRYLQESSERDNILTREKILNNMINERLIDEDLRVTGMDRDSVMQRKFLEVEDQALLDGYARRVTTDTLRVSEQELATEFRNTNTRVKARYVYAATSEEALQLKRRLEGGESFEHVARDVFKDPALAKNGGSLGWFGYGEMERPLEAAAFSLSPGTLSDPVKLNVGYAIINVENRVMKPLASETDFALAKPKLEREIKSRRTKEILKSEGDDIERALQPRFFDAGIAQALAYWTPGQGAAEYEHHLPDSVSATPFAEFGGKTWTAGEFFFRANAMSRAHRRMTTTANDLRAVATGLAIRDVILERAHHMDLARDAQVQKQVQLRRHEVLLERWRNAVTDSIGPRSVWNEDTLRAEYAAHRESFTVLPEAHIAEVLVRTREEGVHVAQLARQGKDFASLARKYSLRRTTAEQGGDLGFATQPMLGPLGAKIFAAPIGGVVGPESIDPFFGVYKVLERKPGRPRTFEEAREPLINALVPARRQAAFVGAISRLRQQSSFSIDMETLAHVIPSVQ